MRSACNCASRAWAPHSTSVTTRFGGCRFYTEMALVHEAQWAGIAKKDADVNQSPPTQAANVKWQVDWLDRRLQECCKTYEGKKPRHKQSEQGNMNSDVFSAKATNSSGNCIPKIVLYGPVI